MLKFYTVFKFHSTCELGVIAREYKFQGRIKTNYATINSAENKCWHLSALDYLLRGKYFPLPFISIFYKMIAEILSVLKWQHRAENRRKT